MPPALRRLLARDALGIAAPEAFREAAQQAMVEGHDGPALRTLAGLDPGDTRREERTALLASASAEVGLERPTPAAALDHLARLHAAAILDGTAHPIDAARAIWNLTRHVDDPPPEALHPFIYAASEWDERPELHEALEVGIRAAAQHVTSAG